VEKPTFQVDYTAFFMGGKLYMLHVTNSIIGVRSMANKEDWAWLLIMWKNNALKLLQVWSMGLKGGS